MNRHLSAVIIRCDRCSYRLLSPSLVHTVIIAAVGLVTLMTGTVAESMIVKEALAVKAAAGLRKGTLMLGANDR